MKRLLLIALVLLTTRCFSQLAVRTESASGLYKRTISATTRDTIVAAKFFEGIVWNKIVASDTVIAFNHAASTTLDTIGIYQVGGTPGMTLPYFMYVGVRVDTLVFYHAKLGDVTYIYRQSY